MLSGMLTWQMNGNACFVAAAVPEKEIPAYQKVYRLLIRKSVSIA
jgi:hypothetical protein